MAHSPISLLRKLGTPSPARTRERAAVAGQTVEGELLLHRRRVKHARLSAVGTLVRRHDPDRFFTALFAPGEKREALLLLYAFNHELARAREVTAEPTIALIRLQWWREVVEGAERRHEVAAPLRDALAHGTLDREPLLALIEAREAEADPSLPDWPAWRRHVLETAGALAETAGAILGAGDSERRRLRALGAAYGAAGILRSVAHHARQGRLLLPQEALAAYGLSPASVAADPRSPALLPVLQEVARAGRVWLREGEGPFSAGTIAAALPAAFARRDLRHEAPNGEERGLADRLAVVAASLRKRI